jgi:hypothetical protein
MELVEDPKLTSPVVSHHLHYFLAEPMPVKEWYVKNMLAAPTMRGPYESVDVPGMNFTFAPNQSKTVPTKGRLLDHIGLEVKNLEAYCKRLEAAGVKFDAPYRQVPNLGIAVAFLTDPWGAYIELTEGLDKLK